VKSLVSWAWQVGLLALDTIHDESVGLAKGGFADFVDDITG
jgi:hypothetical protein